MEPKVALDEYLELLREYRAKTTYSAEDAEVLEKAFLGLSFRDQRHVSRMFTQEARDARRHKPRDHDPEFPPPFNPPDVNLIAADQKEDLESSLGVFEYVALFSGMVAALIAVALKSLMADPTLHPSWPRPDGDTPWAVLFLFAALIITSVAISFSRDKLKKEAAQLRQPIPLVPYDVVFEPLLHNRTKLKIHVTIRMPQVDKTADNCRLIYDAAKSALSSQLYKIDGFPLDPYQDLYDLIGRAVAVPANDLKISVLVWAITEIEGLPPSAPPAPPSDRVYL